MEDIGPLFPKPFQDVSGQPSIMRSGLQYMAAGTGWSLKPLGKLPGEQFAEQTAHTNAGIEITPPSYRLAGTFIVSKIRTVKGQFHETLERNGPLLGEFLAYDFAYIAHSKREWVFWARLMLNFCRIYG